MIIIAEIGCNHRGSMKTAKEMINVLANYCGVDVVKFQKRDNKLLLSKKEYNAPHPCPENSYGETYGEHREALEFTKDQHAELKDLCEESGVMYSCSVWDINSTRDIIELNPDYIKVPSAMNNNFPLLTYLYDNYRGDIHISTGMTTNRELWKLEEFLLSRQAMKRTVIYHCVSDYPVKINNTYMKEMERYSGFKALGFSGHHEGILIDNMAVCAGADYIERHFTLNKNWKGTDHRASLEPVEMRDLVRTIKESCEAWKMKPQEILDCERSQRAKLKKVIE